MKLNLSGEQFFCQELRARAPQHTYSNDLEILLSMKSLLDINMQIPSYEERWLVDLLHRALGGTLKAQQTLLALVIPLVNEITDIRDFRDGQREHTLTVHEINQQDGFKDDER